MPSHFISSSPTRAASPDTIQKARIATKTKKSRAARRRGRARSRIESDDEIERMVSTDSESDSDESLSSDSATDSEEGLASEDGLVDQQIDSHTPNTSHSSGALDKDGGINEKSTEPFFSTSGNWSEMVADDNNDGAADLPVIEFSDFKADVVSTPKVPSKKARKAVKRKGPVSEQPSSLCNASSPPKSVNNDVLEDASPGPQQDKDSSRRSPAHPRRPVGQSARQAYQHKLESDPSFVPKVGGFWGHDDRLMDKDLRSLSGWWRGRWQSRGRGRGAFIPAHGRRGSHVGEENKEDTDNLPPIEQPWTHDGFEEMKRKEDQRLESRNHRQASALQRGVTRGRGGTPAIRGGRGRLPRGGFVNSGNHTSTATRANRVWYAMKPELMWTKQSENFLFFESKYRASGPSYRVQLPGSEVQIISPLPLTHSQLASNHVTAATASTVGSDTGEKIVVVKFPKREEDEPPATVDEASLDAIFKVRPHLVNAEPIPLPAPSNNKSSPCIDKSRPQSSSSGGEPDPSVRSQLEQLTPDAPSIDPARWAQAENAVLRKPTTEAPSDETSKSPISQTASRRPSLPPIQTVYSPPPVVPSPAYPSYSYPALPPGIALNQHGIPYEMTTGRPVYIPTTAPPPMYNPRPIIHSHLSQHSLSYMPPPHMHPSSTMSPDFTAHQPSSHTHTPSLGVNGFIDPATGAPMFSLPRPSRVEIRAPGEVTAKVNGNVKSSSVSSPNGHVSSHLPMTSSYLNSPSHTGIEYGYNSFSSSSDMSTLPSYASIPDVGAPSEAGSNATQQMVHYPAYQQYYYPDPSYVYPQYMDVSQTGQYEMYAPMETHGTTYY